jgi:hypothetical protein
LYIGLGPAQSYGPTDGTESSPMCCFVFHFNNLKIVKQIVALKKN